ncbi:hypothetical protein [Hymenobacter saemangeumensis]|uniref:hypothetical protein n=1 Tax=Hymenobacter saemangeumensis TaxID=1084522 RepID=UPI0031EDA388
MCLHEQATYTLSGVPTNYRVAAQGQAAVINGGTLVIHTGPTQPGSGNNGVDAF